MRFELSNFRGLADIMESQRKAHAQAEELKNVLDEHFLELRVKAANETETACQERLATAKAEIAELRTQLDLSERYALICIFSDVTTSEVMHFILITVLGAINQYYLIFREVLELKEGIKVKEQEAEASIAEMEVPCNHPSALSFLFRCP